MIFFAPFASLRWKNNTNPLFNKAFALFRLRRLLGLVEQELADQFSRTIADCARVILSPSRRYSSAPPASSPTYCSPSRPEVRIDALGVIGKILVAAIDIQRHDRLIGVRGQKCIAATRPTRTPARVTADLTLRLPTFSKRASMR